MLARSGDAFRAPVAVLTEDQPRHAPAKDAGGAPGLLCELVRRYLLLAQVPAADWSRNENALLMLSESILGSALAPSAAMSTEGAVAEAIKKRLASGGPDGVERALRFSKVLAELQGMVCGSGRRTIETLRHGLGACGWPTSLPAIDYGAFSTFYSVWLRRAAGAARPPAWPTF